MKTFLRHVFVNFISILFLTISFPGFIVDLNPKTLLTASIIWFFLNKIVKPIIKLLLLPINLITLNLFSWMVGVLTLFLLQIFADGVNIASFTFPGLEISGFIVPSFFINLFFSYLLSSILLNSIHKSIFWLFKKDED